MIVRQGKSGRKIRKNMARKWHATESRLPAMRLVSIVLEKAALAQRRLHDLKLIFKPLAAVVSRALHTGRITSDYVSIPHHGCSKHAMFSKRR